MIIFILNKNSNNSSYFNFKFAFFVSSKLVGKCNSLIASLLEIKLYSSFIYSGIISFIFISLWRIDFILFSSVDVFNPLIKWYTGSTSVLYIGVSFISLAINWFLSFLYLPTKVIGFPTVKNLFIKARLKITTLHLIFEVKNVNPILFKFLFM